MSRVFADTSFYIAASNPKDEAHAAAVQWMREFVGQVITTDFVIVELANFFCRASQRDTFAALYANIIGDSQAEVVPATRDLLRRGIELFFNRPDKDWSLTDSISFVVMQEHGVSETHTTDHHFEQAGFVRLFR
jgi:predicted nucleic acid-binding protein